MEPCVSNKTPMSSFGDPSSGGTRASTILVNHFGGLRSVSLRVGLSEFSRPASICIEVSFTSFLRANLLYEDPAVRGVTSVTPSPEADTHIVSVRPEGTTGTATGTNQ